MFKPTKATTVGDYLKAVPKERKASIEYLHKFIQSAAPKLKPHFAYNMLGYGSFLYRNYKHETISWPLVALANQKNYISLYVCAFSGKQYLAEKYKTELGKVSVGKSCIRFKKLEDLKLPVLKDLIRQAAKNPGLMGLETGKTIKTAKKKS
jgi:uncharacterized protein YdhG (YjbR/CyaY superfamily)